MRLLLVLALLVVLSPALVSAKRKPGKYWQAYNDEYAEGERLLASIPSTQPQQILTSLSGVAGSITVTWVTMADTNSSVVQWGSDAFDSSNDGSSYHFVDPNAAHRLRVMHTAHMTELKPGVTVRYRVGDAASDSWSDSLSFTMPPSGAEPLRLIVYGDLGLVNAVSVQKVIQEVSSGEADMVLHLGDYAYDLHTKDGSYGDVFGNNIMPISTRVPYLGVQGNHEGKYNASHYRNRFTAYNDLGAASGSNNNWWFSWEYVSGGATVHFAALNTEMYYDYVDENPPPDYAAQRAAQFAWFEADLRAARATADWVVVYGHRPMYCSDVDSLGDCTSDAQVLREGWKGQFGMDDMIAKHNVDIYFTAHEHSYERIFPVWRGQLDPQQNHTHRNPRFPVHIVSGSAGCQEGLEWFDNVNFAAWSVVRSGTYGYGHLIVYNSTALYWDQLLDEGEGGRDWLWILRNETRKGQGMMDTHEAPAWVTQQQ